ncbi:MAG: error-prone DNA polymerase, partial [Actinomycetota bacterium]
QEPVTYLHPLLENSLGKTLGVPLFQEQLMQMAIDLAGFTANQADELRQAMGSKRSQLRMQRLRQRLYDGMARNQIVGAVADEIFEKMRAFANYGFPESHSVSFAYLVYASSWIKYHEPAAFYAALLNSQPMGFWSPHSLVQDARRHGVVVLGPALTSSNASATLQPCTESTGGLAVRLGISGVRGIGDDLAKAIEAARPFSSMEDLVRRVPQLSLAQIEILATAGAYSQCFEV